MAGYDFSKDEEFKKMVDGIPGSQNELPEEIPEENADEGKNQVVGAIKTLQVLALKLRDDGNDGPAQHLAAFIDALKIGPKQGQPAPLQGQGQQQPGPQ